SSRRRHTRFSRDWSSDVCSSDLLAHPALRGQGLLLREARAEQLLLAVLGFEIARDVLNEAEDANDVALFADLDIRERAHGSELRSEERRVGKECRAPRAACQ